MSTLITSSKENLIFEYNQHATNITAKLLKFYKEEQFFDIVLLAGHNSVKIQSHKIILSAFSEYFLEFFRSSPTTSKVSEIKFKEIEASTLKPIIDYMYSGTYELKLEKTESILRCAVLLKIKSLVDGCCDYLEKNISHTDCLHWLRLAKELTLPGLQEKSLNFIYSHFKDVTKQSEFLLLNEIELKDLLFNNNSHDDLEEQVFRSLVTWIEYEKENREPLLLELLSMIRFHFLTPKFILANRKSVCKAVEHCELIYHWLEYHMCPESRTLDEKNLTLLSKSSKEVNYNQASDKFSVFHLNDDYEVEIRSYNQLRTCFLDKRTLPFPKKKYWYSMIVINEQLFVVGGENDNVSQKSIECLDLKTFKCTDLPPMRFARCDSQLANLNGHLCVFGGFEKCERLKFNASVEIFNFTTQKWTDLQPLIKPNEKQKIVGHNGVLYIFDFHYGCLQCYDVSTNQWTTKNLPLDDIKGEFQVVAVDNFLYCVIGGEFDTGKQWISCPNLILKRYNLSKDFWSYFDKVNLRNSCSIGNMVASFGNKILFLNGNNFIGEFNLETKKYYQFPASANYFYNALICPFKI